MPSGSWEPNNIEDIGGSMEVLNMGFEFGEDEVLKDRNSVLKSKLKAIEKLSFMETIGNYGYAVRGTNFVLFWWQGRFEWDDVESGNAVSFEYVWDRCPENIQMEMLFNLDILNDGTKNK